MELTAGAIFAGYRVVRQLGAGGMGSVYLVQHPRLPRQDAMKIVHPHLSSDRAFAARFEREAELACTLDHPALVRVHDRGRDEGRLWLTMQFVDGSDADHALRRDGPLAPPRVLRILEAVADGLDHAHAAGLVHRDVKPANILLSKGGTNGERALLGDFGIAHMSGATRQLTDTGVLLASLPYAAPEQLRDDHPVTGAVDVYGLGCVVYELLTGRRVFDQGSPLALMGAVLAGPHPEAWDALSPGRPVMRAELQRALAAEPGDRHPSCTALAVAVRNAMAPVPATVVSVATPAAPPTATVSPDPWSAQPPPSSAPSWPSRPVPQPRVDPAAHWRAAGPAEVGPAAGPTGPRGPHPGGPSAGGSYPGVPYLGGSPGGGPHPAGAHASGAHAGGARPPARRRWPWLLAVLLLLATAAVGLVVWRPWALASPASVAADVGAEGVELRWTPVEGAAGYEVHRDGVLLDRSDATRYVDAGADSGVRVTYSVTAVADDGERSGLTTAATVVSALHPVGDLTPEVVMTGVQLSWTEVGNAEGYEVRRGDEVLEDGVTGSSFLDEYPPPGTHDYSVVAVDEDGDAPSSTASVVVDVDPWLGAAELAAAFDELVPDTPGPGGWGDGVCRVREPLETSPAEAIIGCDLPSGIHVEYLQYPDQEALEQRIAYLDTLADPAAFQAIAGGGWYRQSPPGPDLVWEAWGFVEPDRRLMEIYVEGAGRTIADLDAAFYDIAPY